MEMKKYIRRTLIIYFIYLITTGALIFLYFEDDALLYTYNPGIESYWSETTGPDQVVLIEDWNDAWLGRMYLIENAEGTLDISYFTVYKGVTTEAFFASLLEAADRGVQVRILLDGIFHNLRGSYKGIKYALVNHPNIELKFYEPLNLLKPWTLQNRLHDKYIIADNKFVMMGGRNIGDEYFLPAYDGERVYDRDIIIINGDKENYDDSVIKDIKEYYEMLWKNDFSCYPVKRLNFIQKNLGKRKEVHLREQLAELRDKFPELFEEAVDWRARAVAANKISLITNPLTRFNKEPRILMEIGRLVENTESISILSPYIIPTKQMLKYINMSALEDTEITVITNSLASSPNYPGIAGQINKRERIADFVTYLYEYQGDGSIHAKSIILDERSSLIGSFNIDARSSFLSTESMVLIDSEEFNGLLRKSFNDLKEKSLLVGEDYSYVENPSLEARKVPIFKGILVGFLRIFAYFIDFLL